MLLKYTLICQHIWFYAGHLMDFLNSKGSYSLTLFVDSIFTDWPTHQNLFVTSKSILGHLCVYLWTCTQRKKVAGHTRSQLKSNKAKRIDFFKSNGLQRACWDKLFLRDFVSSHSLRFAEGVLDEEYLFTTHACLLASLQDIPRPFGIHMLKRTPFRR